MAPSNLTDPPRRRAPRAAGLALALAGLLAPSAALASDGRVVSPAVVAFWALSLLTIASAAGVAFSRNILYSSFSLLGAFLGVAGLYIFLSADFLAVAQVLIYVGGVLVLILFAVMLTSRIENVRITNKAVGLLPAALTTSALTALLVFVGARAPWMRGAEQQLAPTTATLGDLFLNQYLLPFEIASVVLLATLVGAVVMARKELKPD